MPACRSYIPRNTDAIAVLERAALLGTSTKHEQADVNLDLLWGNLDAVQQGTWVWQKEMEKGAENEHEI